MMLHTEFQAGNVPAGHEQLRVLKEALSCLSYGVKKVWLRSDTARYQHDLVRYRDEENNNRFGRIDFAIGCDVTEEFRELYRQNLGESDKTLQIADIPHLFIYPRCPKINSIIERYNRTIQEEFIDNHLDIIHGKSLFHTHLANYMVFYRTKRIHKSLDKMTPVDYLIKKGGMSHLYGTYTSD